MSKDKDKNKQDSKQGNNQSKSQSENGKKEKLNGAEKSQGKQDPPPTILEWSVRIISLGAILGLMGYIIWMGIAAPTETGIEHSIVTEKIAKHSDEWSVPTLISNVGPKTLLDLEIALQLVDSEGEVVEEEALSVAMIGREEEKNLVYWFSEDPSEFELRFDVAGYKLP